MKEQRQGRLVAGLRRYAQPNSARASFELVVTVIPLTTTWILTCWTFAGGLFGLYILFSVLSAGFLVRLFMIQHDCGHGAFFPSRRANDWTGRIIGVVTLTAYDHWRRCHARHHATSGNLERRGTGDIQTLTVAEYSARTMWGRLRYRLYRHPAVMFGLGPFYLFLLQNRIPVGYIGRGWRPWRSTMGTNAAILAVSALSIWALGLGTFVCVYFPVVLLSAAIGVWLFYVQHQFEHTYWSSNDDWSARDAALQGSSFYDLPATLNWFTANIGLHHVHHLSSRIPFYRLPQAIRDRSELRSLRRLTLRDSFRCRRLVLWDEQLRRLVTFADLRGTEGLANANENCPTTTKSQSASHASNREAASHW